LATRFESLGGGSFHSGNWGFGCEFGFFQFHSGAAPLGLLRWASIGAADLISALNDDFCKLESLDCYVLNEAFAGDWGFVHTGHNIYCDHSGLHRNTYTKQDAAQRLLETYCFYRRLMLENLAAGEKIFVYRIFDGVLSSPEIISLARAVRRHGPGKLLYVQRATPDNPPFTVRYAGANLLMGYIDAFAPTPNGIVYNTTGWDRLCRAALAIRTPRY
jgi:hypothetical protein